jgi:hypothetical protein
MNTLLFVALIDDSNLIVEYQSYLHEIVACRAVEETVEAEGTHREFVNVLGSETTKMYNWGGGNQTTVATH